MLLVWAGERLGRLIPAARPWMWLSLGILNQARNRVTRKTGGRDTLTHRLL